MKEVGHGIGAAAVAELTRLPGELPVSAIDVAGSGRDIVVAGGATGAALDWLQDFGEELRICLHNCGAADLAALRRIGVASVA